MKFRVRPSTVIALAVACYTGGYLQALAGNSHPVWFGLTLLTTKIEAT